MLLVSISYLAGLFLPLSFNNTVAGIHRAVEAGLSVSPILFPRQQPRPINGSVLLRI